jgi:hypothetical protein
MATGPEFEGSAGIPVGFPRPFPGLPPCSHERLAPSPITLHHVFGMPLPSHLLPFVVGGILLVGLALAWWAGYGLGVYRSHRTFGRLTAQQQRQQEVDRERLRLTLEKVQADLAKAAADLEQMNAERRRALSDRARLEREAAEAQELLRDAAATRVSLESELRKQRELQQHARATQSALDTEVRLRQETEKALSAAGAAVAKAHKQLANAEAACALERQRVMELTRAEEEVTSRLAQQATRLQQQATQLQVLERRLEEMMVLEPQLAVAGRRIGSLERELAEVTQVASTVGAVELDREELAARLEMAAVAARIATKEADRYRTEVLEKTQELTSKRQELALVRGEQKAQAEELEQGRQAQQSLTSVQSELRQLRANVDQQKLNMGQLGARAELAERALEEQRRAQETLATELRQSRAREQSYQAQGDELSALRAELEVEQQRVREQMGTQAAHERLEKELQAARRQLLFQKEQTEELDRLRELLQRARDEQRTSLEAERRLLTTEAELEAVRKELLAATRRLEEVSGGREGATPQRHDSLRAKALGEELDVERAAARELRGRLQLAEGQLLDLERLRGDNRALREEASELRQHQEASLLLEQLQSDHRKLRLEWELATRRVEELSAEREELTTLRGDAEQQKQLGQEVQELRRREHVLEAQIYGLGQTPETQTSNVLAPTVSVGTRAAEIETAMASLVAGGQRTVVLADRQGFAVASGGESLSQDGLAAFSALVGDVARRAGTLLPLGTVEWVRVIDKNHTQLSCRLFEWGSESFTLSTLGQSAVDPETVDQVMSQVATRITTDESHGSEEEPAPGPTAPRDHPPPAAQRGP